MSSGWTPFQDALLEIIVGPLVAGIILSGVLIFLLSPLVFLGALWEARLGPGRYWESFRCCFATGWRNTVSRALACVLELL